MMLGGFAFEAMGFGYDGLSRSVQTPWAEIDVAQRLDAQQWTGPKSDEITIKGVLFPAEFGGQSSLDGIIAAAFAGEKMMFVSGNGASGRIHGWFTIQSVDEDRGFIDADGVARRNAYAIRIRRYGGDGSLAALITTFVSLFG
jgi:phage protein U